LNTDSLSKETVSEIEKLADSLNAIKSTASFKKAKVQGIPRQAILKPSYAVYRLQNQRFSLGDRVIMAQDSGSVPLCARGVVVGLSNDSIDVIWDAQFISGTTLNGRCTEYRGSSVPRNSCLNLTDQQFCTSTKPKTQPAPILAPPPQQAPGLRGDPPHRGRGGTRRSSREIKPTQIMRNPNRSQYQSDQGHSNPSPSTFVPPPVQAGHSQGSQGAELKAPLPDPVVSHANSQRNTPLNRGSATQNRSQSRGSRRFNPMGRGDSVLPPRGLNSVGRAKFKARGGHAMQGSAS